MKLHLCALALSSLALVGAGCTGPSDPTPPDLRSLSLTTTVAVGGSIQAAIDGADDGAVIVLAAGTHTEDIVVPPHVTVRGEAPGATTLRGTITTDAAAGSTIADLVVSGAASDPDADGVTLVESSARLERVTVTGFGGYGVRVVGSGATIDAVTVRDCGVGLGLDGAHDTAVTNVVIAFNAGAGIVLSGDQVSGATVAHALVIGNGFGANPAAAGVHFAGGTTGTLVNSIVTSNGEGLRCDGACSHARDLVWGNFADYTGVAAPAPDDVRKDPRLVLPSEGDFRLADDSPARDAADPTWAPDHDLVGVARPQGGAPDLGPLERPAPTTADGVVISEVLANPIVESTGEVVELFNGGAAAVDLAGWVLDDGDASDTLVGWQGGGTTLAAGAYAVIVDPDYPGDYAIPDGTVLLTVGDSALGNGLSTGDPLTLTAPGAPAPADTYTHPFNPGNGVSVEKDNLDDGDLATNWVASPCGMSLGAPNCAAAPPAPTSDVAIVINEVMANPLDESTGEFVELLNVGLGAVDLAGFVLDDGDSTDELAALDGGSTVLAPGQLALILDPDYAGQYTLSADTLRLTAASSATLGNGLSVDDPIRLLDLDGLPVSAYTPPADAGNGVSMERVSNDEASFVASPCASGSSPGEPNCASGGGPPPAPSVDLVITEVMANPVDEDTGEFVELYNRGAAAVELAGLLLSDGDTEEPLEAFAGGSTTLQPGAWAVVLDREYAGEYDLPGAAVLMTTDDTSVGSGLATNDPLTLRSPDGAQPIATFAFPFNPGNGLSAERIDINAADLAHNWATSPCGASPGAANCISGGTPPPEHPLQVAGVVISEVIANPLDEGTGELVELYNAGPTAVDLAGWGLSDGDADDLLVAFDGGPTTLAPGGFAVILDRDYAGDYVIAAGATRVTVEDATLDNGLATSDPIVVRDADGAVVATFSFPANPGNGRSIEALTLTGGDVAANWAPSTCAPSTGAPNAYSSPGARSCADGHAAPSGARAVGQPCPNGGADCASGLCALDPALGSAVCTADCAGGSCPSGAECVASADSSWPSLCVGDGSSPAPPTLIINEIVFDGIGVDRDVYVELAGPPGAVLDGVELVGVNGSNGNAYNAMTLSGQVGADGYFVVAHPSAGPAILAAADMVTGLADLQNGPDSVVLRYDGQVLDALGYGEFDAGDVFAGEGSAAPDQAPGSSLCRYPDRVDTGDNGADFVPCVPTPGAENESTAAVPDAARLLISEVVVSPTAAEMVEIHNPNGFEVDLSHVYLADYPAYFEIAGGTGAPTSADFRLRFPDGAVIAAGGYLTISLETSAHFLSEHGTLPDFDLSSSTVDAPAMAGEYTGSASLSNGDELLVLFYWDGASDLVVDLDYVVWGGAQTVDKSYVGVSSSHYLAETPASQQSILPEPGAKSVSRCDLGEGAQLTSGGNGFAGSDQTSEDLSATFQLLGNVTPGAANACEVVCVPDCDGASCGGDGCGGTCGFCGADQVCDDGQCITPATPLVLEAVSGWTLPDGDGGAEEVTLFTSAAEVMARFGVPAPSDVDFSEEWLIFYSAGMRNVPGHISRVTEVVDNTAELFVFTELQVPGEGCEVLQWTRPAWTLVRFPRPASGATALTVIGGEDDFDCTTDGVHEGNTCDDANLCEAGTICCGTTWDFGLCFEAWMHQVFDVRDAAPIPDGDDAGLLSPVTVTGLATVPMDAIVKVHITHPDPSQLTLSLSMPPQWDGEPTYEDIFWDREDVDGDTLVLHMPVGFVGDESVNGVWTLKVVDHSAGASGTLDRWSLELTSRWD